MASLDESRLAALVALGRKLLLANRFTGARVTRPSLQADGSRWVYRREGENCRRCGAPIEMRRQGALARSTYFCPRCQRPAAQGRGDFAPQDG